MLECATIFPWGDQLTSKLALGIFLIRCYASSRGAAVTWHAYQLVLPKKSANRGKSRRRLDSPIFETCEKDRSVQARYGRRTVRRFPQLWRDLSDVLERRSKFATFFF